MSVTTRPGWSCGEPRTITGIMAHAVETACDQPFLDFSGEEYSYREIDRQSTILANALGALGVRAGTTVLSMLDNSVDAVLVWLAINKLSAISVPINTAFRGEFLRHQAVDAGASLFVVEANYVERFAAIEDRLPNAKLILYRGALPKIPQCSIAIAALDRYRGSDASRINTAPKPEDLALLIYTSGTTGPSKGCMISHNYAAYFAQCMLNAIPLAPDETVWTPFPLFHMNAIAGTVLSTMMVGGRASIFPRFSLSQFWTEIKRSGACVATAFGSMVSLIARAPDNDAMRQCFGQIRAVRGSPFPAEIQQIWRERFGVERPGSNSFGITEAWAITSLAWGQKAKPGSSGRLTDNFDVRIVDDCDRELGPNEAGEIIVRPLKPHIMSEGYWNRPADTIRAWRNLWFHTGDIGKFDEEGFLYFVDRKKDYLRRRGENVSSFEMETALSQHPAIEEVAVHAVRSELTEDDIKVTAVLKPRAKLSEEDLCRWSVDWVPLFAVPRYIEFRDMLPKNSVGRVLKYQLREEGATAKTWDREKAGFRLSKR